MKTLTLIAALAISATFAIAADADDKRITVTKDNFAEEVEKSKTPILVDFWAPWCGPCRKLDPLLKEIATENKDVKIAKLNTDDNQELAKKFKITGIPCMIIFKDGKEVGRQVGLLPKKDIEAFIAKHTK